MLRENFGRTHNISYKGKIDLVTDTDLYSEEVIVNFLNREFPGFGMLAEERNETKPGSLFRWILDPLDGTTNYAHGYPFFSVSLALEQEKTVVWGAVYDPVLDEMFTSELGRGASLNGYPVKVSLTDTLIRGLLCTGFPYDVHESTDNNLDHFENFVKVAQGIRRDGSAALDLCYVATGRLDGFWENKLKPWDIAAGSLMVSEAGGKVTGFDGQAFDINRGEVLASNLRIHDEMVKVLLLDR